MKPDKPNSFLDPPSHNMYIRDWRKALRSPPSYRIGNTTFRFHFHFLFIMICLATLILLFFYLTPGSRSSYSDNLFEKFHPPAHHRYNYTYPLTAPIISNGIRSYRFGIIADLDKESRISGQNEWRSFFKKGYLSYTQSTEAIVVTFDEDPVVELRNQYSLNGRGMELSELVTFNGKLLTFDDRTGLIFELNNEKLTVLSLLMDGDGKTSKGFKSEWATVKDEVLYVGSMGKEWTTANGDFQNFDPMYVKAVSMTGEIRHIDWVSNYKKLREALGIQWPGYMIHESGMWSAIHRKWFFLPRRCSKNAYNETLDEMMGCNALISAEENFTKIKVVLLQDFKPSLGFSSFKFVPGTDDSVIVALQTEELNGKTSTYITAFTLTGKSLLASERINTDLKYEGLEFI
ncbi:Soluble calcium-activated nucleotidase 1 [Pseudolycoriella hygida]|uniref:Apyrase n=1 Tax=Pseudolycoriella hygida TaxID=35572 RepID=A0A9Q0MIC8_9DIPT|nr:Soluble calcium-activated nucleotidase 1 [Pseudolycoriella hygida]